LEGDLEKSLEGLENSAAEYPDPEVYLRWARVLEMLGRSDESVRESAYERARERALLARDLDEVDALRERIDALLERLSGASATG
jgi:hypothetical protein